MGELSANNRIAKNTLFLFLRTAFALLVSLYTSRVVLRTLGVTDYGVYNVVAGFVSMFSFLNGSLSSGVQRFYNFELSQKGESGITKVYICATVVQVVLVLILLISLETIGVWYINNKLVVPIERLDAARYLFQFSVISMILVVMVIPYSAAIMAHERMDYYAIVGIIDVVIKLAIVLALPYINADQLIVYGFLTLCITVLNFLLYFLYAKKNFKSLSLSHFSLDRGLLKSMLGFSGWHVFGTFAQIGRTQGINLVLNFFFGPVVNAARGVTYQIQSALMGFIGNIVAAARPQLVQSYAQSNISRTMNLMYSIGKICFFALLSMVIPVALEIDFILDLWLGSDAVPNYTNIFTILVLMIALVDILNTPVSMVVHATGDMKKYQLVTSCISLFILPLGFVAFRLGAPPVAIFVISLLTSAVMQFASLLILRGLVRFSLRDYFVKVVVPIFMVAPLSLGVPLVVRLIMPEGFLRLVVVVVLAVSAVLLTAFRFGLAKSEKDLVIEIKNSVLKKIKIKKNDNK